ncbi:MAG: OmpA family protein [Pseudomonadota bacterium]|jgi:peptidoglycan-associated lipoprotein
MKIRLHLILATSVLALAACDPTGFDREAGAEVDEGGFGNPTLNNHLLQTGQLNYVVALAERFSREVPDTITFAFNSAQLDDAARTTLRAQADWIRQFPEVRFRVFGHTDLVGSDGYNKALGLRRAKAAVAYLASQGISTARLEAVVSYGETQPIIQTQSPEERNRRTVTEVSGFLTNHPTLLNGKYAAVIFREYIKLGERAHPGNANVETQVDPGQ